jgi:dTDP-4-dehydrorhamnose 3,5-epimerase
MNSNLSIEETKLKGAYIITSFCREDERGSFIKDYSSEWLVANNLNHKLVEVFYTNSKKGVIRAIHFQIVKEQAKLVRCIKGSVFDVIVDLRKNSPTYSQWISVILNDRNNKSIYVPKGFGHGYLVLEDSIVSYKCDEKFYPQYDTGIKWNDEKLNINWPIEQIDARIIISDKDKNLQSFQDYKISQQYE